MNAWLFVFSLPVAMLLAGLGVTYLLDFLNPTPTTSIALTVLVIAVVTAGALTLPLVIGGGALK